MKRLNQSGSHVVALLVLVLVLGAVGFAGYRVMQRNSMDDATQTATKVPATITTSADLDKTSQALDQTTGDLDSSLNDSAFDADLNSML